MIRALPILSAPICRTNRSERTRENAIGGLPGPLVSFAHAPLSGGSWGAFAEVWPPPQHPTAARTLGHYRCVPICHLTGGLLQPLSVSGEATCRSSLSLQSFRLLPSPPVFPRPLWWLFLRGSVQWQTEFPQHEPHG